MSVPEANLDRLPTWPARNVHDAAVRGKVDALRNQLSLGNADGVHQFAELPQARRIGVERSERVRRTGTECLLPAWAVLSQRVGQILTHVIERPALRDGPELHRRSRRAELPQFGVAEGPAFANDEV